MASDGKAPQCHMFCTSHVKTARPGPIEPFEESADRVAVTENAPVRLVLDGHQEARSGEAIDRLAVEREEPVELRIARQEKRSCLRRAGACVRRGAGRSAARAPATLESVDPSTRGPAAEARPRLPRCARETAMVDTHWTDMDRAAMSLVSRSRSGSASSRTDLPQIESLRSRSRMPHASC